MGLKASKSEDEMWLAWQKAAPRIYEKTYYQENSLVACISDAGHRLMERMFDKDTYFPSVLEVGAGTGYHLPFVRHRYDHYLMTDLSPDLLIVAQEKYGDRYGLAYKVQDATNLNYADASFDRLISVYNLEHLPHPHLVLKEWRRVLKPGGVLTISIPLDGGVAWRLGRYLSTRHSFAREGLDLDYIIAREHINPSYNLISLIHHYFKDRREFWYPLKLPIVDINLVYVCLLKKDG
jgi:phosphatidylethanolamine/phosphatidyl-N-methylethanolamine N-methyltransferase